MCFDKAKQAVIEAQSKQYHWATPQSGGDEWKYPAIEVHSRKWIEYIVNANEGQKSRALECT